MEPKDMVKALREEMKLNRREFCDYFNIPYRTVQDWECGKRVMPEYVLRLLEYKIRVDQMIQDKCSEKEQTEEVTMEEGKTDKKSLKSVGSDVSICNMCAKDYQEVHALWMSCDGVGLNETDDSEGGIARFLLRNPETCFVARKAKKIVGVILAGHDGRRGHIYHLAVDKQHRREGIAGQLVNQTVQALEKQGIQKAALVAFSDNEEGNDFWEKMGFTVREDLTYRNRMTKKQME